VDQKEMQKIVSHFPREVSKEIENFITNTVLLNSRYVFVQRSKGSKQQYGYCTHCKKQFKTNDLKHNQDTQCPECKSLCIVKQSGLGRSQLVDSAYFVWYEKSLVNSQAMVARGIYVKRDYSGDYRKVVTEHSTVVYYLFEPGQSSMMMAYGWGGWAIRKEVGTLYHTTMNYNRCYVSIESIHSAVKGTPFQYSTWENYLDYSEDMVQFFDLAAKYPCIEYLSKMGLQHLITHKLRGFNTYRAINWRGKTINKVLRLSKVEIKELLTIKHKTTPLTLHSYHHFKKQGIQLTFEEAHELCNFIDGYRKVDLNKITEYAPLARVIKYIFRQLAKPGVKKRYSSADSIVGALRDYIRDCIELGMDLTQEHVLFPNNLYEAHQKTIRKVKIKVDESLNLKITARLKELEIFRFEYQDLLIRPAASSIELFEEGKKLNHCVGGYSKNYADGKTNLFVLRKASDPDKPFYTVEMIGKEIVQVRGLRNCKATKEIEAFMKVFKAEKLTKIANPRKPKKTEREVVAV
jgi:DNA-directed RNA polymerase subunit RPC12/RpoP